MDQKGDKDRKLVWGRGVGFPVQKDEKHLEVDFGGGMGVKLRRIISGSDTKIDEQLSEVRVRWWGVR